MAPKRVFPKKPGGTAFVPRIVFRTLFKSTIPLVSATVLPACLALRAYSYDSGTTTHDASRDRAPDVGETKPTDAASAKKLDGAQDNDGAIGATDASKGH